jgi:ubiquinone/menaquinone biosynthesis C-methylase UbiE
MTKPSQPLYVCGYSERELERLEIQGTFFEDASRRFLETAGLTRGMRVLDIGCGVGNLSLLAAEMVGPKGSVLGVDRAPDPLERAQALADGRGMTHVQFRLGAIEELPLGSPVDALIGRFVLMHQADPALTLSTAVRHVRAGGLVAILESHMHGLVAGVHSCPHSPTYDRIVGWLTEVIRAAGAHADMGLRLRQVFVEAGLPAPRLSLQASVEGGPDAAIYRYITDSLRSMLPLAAQFGIAALSLDEVDELERQLREELAVSSGVLTSPMVVGAWCQLPQ